VQRPEEESTSATEWLAEEEESVRLLQAQMTKIKAGLASTDDLVEREEAVNEVLCMVVEVPLTSDDGPETYRAEAAAAESEQKRLWGVAAHATTFAVTAAAAAAAAKTPAARAKVTRVAQTAARAAGGGGDGGFCWKCCVC
jgi:hypothetical protein